MSWWYCWLDVWVGIGVCTFGCLGFDYYGAWIWVFILVFWVYLLVWVPMLYFIVF